MYLMKKESKIKMKKLSLLLFLFLFCTNAFSQNVKHATKKTQNIPETKVVEKPTIAELLKQILPSVVIVKASKTNIKIENIATKEQNYYRYIENNNIFSIGSGFVISTDGQVLTNAHVVENADKIIIEYNNTEVEANLIGYDAISDIALLKMKNKSNVKYLELKKTVSYDIGDNIFIIGNPYNVGISVSQGIISAINRSLQDSDYENLIQTDAVINKGNSGGPMFNSDGEVIGINSVIFSPSGTNIGVGFAIPTKNIIDIIDKLNRYGYIQRGWIGIDECMDLQEKDFDLLSLSINKGCIVLNLVKDSPADKIGIKIGDIVTSYNGKSITSFNHLTSLVRNTSVNSLAEIVVARNGSYKKYSVIIQEYLADIKEKEKIQEIKKNTITEFNINFIEIDKTIIEKFNLQNDQSGLFVLNVLKDSYAYNLGIREGDILVSINQNEIKTKNDFLKIINNFKLNNITNFLTIFKQGKQYTLIKF